MAYLRNPTGFLVYMGPPGCGKTHLCAGMIEWVSTKFNSYYYTNEQNFLSKLRKVVDAGWDYQKEIVDRFDHDFLIYDDLGSGRLSDWAKDCIFSLIDFRYSVRRPTVFTSNFFRDNIHEAAGPRGADRLLDKENTIIEAPNAFSFRR